MIVAEDQPCDQPCKGDVRCCRDPPSAVQLRGSDDMVEQEVDESRPDNPPGGRQQRIDRLLNGMKITTREKALGDLHGGNTEKKDHENVIGKEMKTDRAKESSVQEARVALRSAVRPDKRQDDAAQKRDGKFTKKIDAVFHEQYPCLITNTNVLNMSLLQKSKAVI